VASGYALRHLAHEGKCEFTELSPLDVDQVQVALAPRLIAYS